MKFVITRTSFYSDETPPCDGVKREVLTRTVRIAPTARGEHANWPAIERHWRSFGRNHRDEGETLAKEIDQEHWVIEIFTLAKLLDFAARHGGSLVVDHDGDGAPSVEIYDEPRE